LIIKEKGQKEVSSTDSAEKSIGKRTFDSVDAFFKIYASNIWGYISRMPARTFNHRMTYLLQKQSDLLDSFAGGKVARAEKLKEKIIDMFKKMEEDFDLKHCYLFVPELERGISLYDH